MWVLAILLSGGVSAYAGESGESVASWFEESIALPPEATGAGQGTELVFDAVQLAPFALTPAQRAVLNVVLREEPRALLTCPGYLEILASRDSADLLFSALWWLHMGMPHLAMRSGTDSLMGGLPDAVFLQAILLINEASKGAEIPDGPWVRVAARAAGRLTGRGGATGRYLLGRELLIQGRPDLADQMLSGIPLGSPLQSRAAYLRGLASISFGRLRGGIRLFRTSAVLAEREGKGDLRDMGLMALARFAGEMGLFEEAEDRYRNIDPKGRLFSAALYELVVTQIRADRSAEALALLEVLAVREPTPFSFPDSGLLLSLVLESLCYWEYAEDVTSDWKAILENALASLDSAVGTWTQETAYADFERLFERGDRRALMPILMEVVRDREFWTLHREVRRLMDEIGVAEDLPGDTGRAALALLRGLLDVHRKLRTQRVYDVSLGIRERLQDVLARTSEELIDITDTRRKLIETSSRRLLHARTDKPREALILARVVDLTRAGKTDDEIIEDTKQRLARRPVAFTAADVEWLRRRRVGARLVEALLALSGDREDTSELPWYGGETMVWEDVREHWIDELAWMRGGLKSRCGTDEDEGRHGR